MCLDYQQLNQITIKSKYLSPRIDELFDQQGTPLLKDRFEVWLPLVKGEGHGCIHNSFSNEVRPL